jgi:hypothetical protein
MKKTLIPALLIAFAAFAPSAPNGTTLPDRVCEVAHSVASPVFWHLWDQLISRELARSSQTVKHGQGAKWQSEGATDALACIFLHMVLKHAFDSVLTVTERDDVFHASVSQNLIRLAAQSVFTSVPQYPAR